MTARDPRETRACLLPFDRCDDRDSCGCGDHDDYDHPYGYHVPRAFGPYMYVLSDPCSCSLCSIINTSHFLLTVNYISYIRSSVTTQFTSHSEIRKIYENN